MTGVQLAYALLVGALLAGTARCLSEACRLAGRPTRWVWMSALALTVVLVGLAPYRVAPPAPSPAVPMVLAAEAPLSTATIRVEAAPTAPGWLDRLHRIGPAVAVPMQAAISAVGARVPAALIRYFGFAWLVLSTLLLGLCIATYVRYYRLRRRWPITDLDGVRVRVAPDGGPAVVGWSRPEIIIPHWLLRHSREERRLVLAHEREHVIARDPLLIALGCAAAVLLPWHPAVWWMFARLRLAVELDCDGRVLRQGITPRKYGALLIELAGRCPGLPVGAPALADKSSHLKQRLLAMRAPRLSFARTRGAALGMLALLVLIAACIVQVPKVVQAQQQDRSQDRERELPPSSTPGTDTVPVTLPPVVSLLESTPAAPVTAPSRRGAANEGRVQQNPREFTVNGGARVVLDSAPASPAPEERRVTTANGARMQAAMKTMAMKLVELPTMMSIDTLLMKGVATRIMAGQWRIDGPADGVIIRHMPAPSRLQMQFDVVPAPTTDSSGQSASEGVVSIKANTTPAFTFGLANKLAMISTAPVVEATIEGTGDSTAHIASDFILFAPSSHEPLK